MSQLSYVQCIGKHFPTVNVVCYGDDFNYDNIVHEGGDPLPPKSELDSLIFDDTKIDKISELSVHCQKIIINGFQSDALGSTHIYDSEEVDQLNIIGSVSMISPTYGHPEGYTTYYAVRPIQDGITQPKEYKIHTYAQLRKAMTDGAMYKLGCLQRFNVLRDYINSLVFGTHTLDIINSVDWDTQL